MQADLYFLISRSPPGATEGAYTPCRMRIKSVGVDPLVAFAAASYGEQFMGGRGIGKECIVLRFSDLEPSVAAAAKTQSILFFDTPDLVERYLAEGPKFDSHGHIRSFEDTCTHVQRAL